jgi:hypothetical protein
MSANEEQSLIRAFHGLLTGGGGGGGAGGAAALLGRVDREFRDSVFLNYYAGVYSERVGQWADAERRFLKCLSLREFFTPPYFALADQWIANGRWGEAEKILLRIFDKKTMDPMSGTLVRRYAMADQLRIVSLLGPGYIGAGQIIPAIKVYETIRERVREELAAPTRSALSDSAPKTPYILAEGWKNLSYALGNAYMSRDSTRAETVFTEGLTGGVLPAGAARPPGGDEWLTEMNRRLIQALVLSQHYVRTPRALPVSVDEVFGLPAGGELGAVGPRARAVGSRIRLGYISPDFNKNAVGLFLTPLLRHYDPSRFQIYCYNIQPKGDDEFTPLFREAPGVTWVDAAEMSDAVLVDRIVRVDRLDVLVDLIAHGVGNRFGAVAAVGAAGLIVVNYLGCPSSAYSRAVSYRIGDRVADPPAVAERDYTEKMIYLPRTFLCYSLFASVFLPPIAPRVPPWAAGAAAGASSVRIGVFNKQAKQSAEWVAMMKRVLSACPNVTLCLKGAAPPTVEAPEGLDGWRDIWGKTMESRVRVMPFTARLEDYLDQFNDVDFCVDTFPYSGTTTTCSALVMGVGTFTIYRVCEGDGGGAGNRHVSNVSASLMQAVAAEPGAPKGDGRFMGAKTLGEMEERIVKEIRGMGAKGFESRRSAGDVEERRARRVAFQGAMEPGRFMREYEAGIAGALRAC